MKRNYEIVLIFNCNRPDEEIQAHVKKVTELITGNDGIINKTDHWGKRKLAYLIKKEAEGYYVLINFELDSSMVKEVHRRLNIDDGVLKYMQIAEPKGKVVK